MLKLLFDVMCKGRQATTSFKCTLERIVESRALFTKPNNYGRSKVFMRMHVGLTDDRLSTWFYYNNHNMETCMKQQQHQQQQAMFCVCVQLQSAPISKSICMIHAILIIPTVTEHAQKSISYRCLTKPNSIGCIGSSKHTHKHILHFQYLRDRLQWRWWLVW